jgi:hypothetical protein
MISFSNTLYGYLSTYKCGLSHGTEGERNGYSSETGKGVTCGKGKTLVWQGGKRERLRNSNNREYELIAISMWVM